MKLTTSNVRSRSTQKQHFWICTNAIMDSVGYTKDQMCSFFICDDDWSKNTEITLVEMDTSSEVDNYIMEDTRLEELLEDEHQKLLFVFDYMTERAFFMELREIIPGKDLDKAVCSKSIGEAPVQIMSFDEMDAKTGNTEIGEDFYGDSDTISTNSIKKVSTGSATDRWITHTTTSAFD